MIHFDDSIDHMQLDCVYGGAPGDVCTPDDPMGRANQTSVSAWSGRYCDGPQTTLRMNLEYAHRIPDMMNTAIQLDLQGFNEANARQRPRACLPGDVASTP
jgi:hypothetical protein